MTDSNDSPKGPKSEQTIVVSSEDQYKQKLIELEQEKLKMKQDAYLEIEKRVDAKIAQINKFDNGGWAGQGLAGNAVGQPLTEDEKLNEEALGFIKGTGIRIPTLERKK